MKSKLLTKAALLSLLLFIGAMGLWLRGIYATDYIGHNGAQPTVFVNALGHFVIERYSGVQWRVGANHVIFGTKPIFGPGWFHDSAPGGADTTWAQFSGVAENAPEYPAIEINKYRDRFECSHWLAICVTLLIPFAWLLDRLGAVSLTTHVIAYVEQSLRKASSKRITAFAVTSWLAFLLVGVWIIIPDFRSFRPGEALNILLTLLLVTWIHVWWWQRWSRNAISPVSNAADPPSTPSSQSAVYLSAGETVPMAAIAPRDLTLAYAHRGLSRRAKIALWAVILQQIIALLVVWGMDVELIQIGLYGALACYWGSLFIIALSRRDQPMTRLDALLINAGFWAAVAIMFGLVGLIILIR